MAGETDMAKDNEVFDFGGEEELDFSLESILAEYKGSAFISGDKKTPKTVLDDKAERIILEAEGKIAQSEEFRSEDIPAEPAAKEEEASFFSAPAPEPAPEPAPPAADNVLPPSEPAEEEPTRKKERKSRFFLRRRHREPETIPEWENGPGLGYTFEPEPEPVHEPVTPRETPTEENPWEDLATFEETEDNAREKEREDEFFKQFDYANIQSAVTPSGSAMEYDEEEPAGESFFARLIARFKGRDAGAEAYDEYDDYDDYEDYEEELEPEPDLMEESKKFAAGFKSLTIRFFAAAVICFFMVLFTYLFDGGKSVPFGIGKDQILLTGVLLIMQLVVMMMGIDVLLDGLKDLIKGDPGGESLVFMSCFISGIVAAIMIAKGYVDNGLPFCTVSACSLAFAIYGKRSYAAGMINTLRTAVAASSPYAVVSDHKTIEDRVVLKKISISTAGFYRNLGQRDACETAYAYAAPLFVVAALLFAIITVIGRGSVQSFGYSFSGMIAISASFSALLAYNVPFKKVSVHSKRSGGAIAGWGGASEMYMADGALITDYDLFPVGTISLNGIKLFGGISQNKAFAYTASVIVASGSGLAKVFSDLLKSQGIAFVKTEDFACYEGGGVGAVIHGERVLVGSGAFMNLMGIRIHNGINMKNAVFTAINDELVATFAVNYVPANSVQNALVSVLKTRISMLFAVRDFNMTPLMLKQKFKVPMDNVEYIPVEDCYKVSEDSPEGALGAVAVLCREGLGPFGEVISQGRQLHMITMMATMISVISSALCLLIFFFLCFKGAFVSASAANVLTFMLIAQFIEVILFRFIKR